ncbi:MAG: hypothetical protein JOZ18_04105 [Chloroflexi bacterium]|nr:hypothetical protein [Chloroflexota bacterium]
MQASVSPTLQPDRSMLSNASSSAAPALSSSALTSKENAGFLTAGIGGVVALFAFFVLPFILLPLFGGITLTGSQLANMGGQPNSIFGNAAQGMQILWLAPLIALVVIAIAAYQLFKSKPVSATATASEKQAAIWVIILGAIMLFILLIRLIIDSQPPNQSYDGSYSGPIVASFYGAGFWIYALSMVVVVVGGSLQLRGNQG